MNAPLSPSALASATLAADHPNDLELAALISSKICHDIINPVGAIYNGIEILDENKDADSKAYALQMIRNVVEQASARLQFARFAFGAAGSAGSVIDLTLAEQITRGFMGTGKHKLVWTGQPGFMGKDKVKLLLNLIASSITALPRGGEVRVEITGAMERPTFRIACVGTNAKMPLYLTDYVTAGSVPSALDAMSVQAYYTWRLSGTAHMAIGIEKAGADIVLTAVPA